MLITRPRTLLRLQCYKAKRIVEGTMLITRPRTLLRLQCYKAKNCGTVKDFNQTSVLCHTPCRFSVRSLRGGTAGTLHTWNLSSGVIIDYLKVTLY